LNSALYAAAARAARFAKAKGAADKVIVAAHRTCPDALNLEAGAKRRLADEYDAAQERGEFAANGQHRAVPNGNSRATPEDAGLTRKEILEARTLRDAEETDPGGVRRALDEAVDAGKAPTRAVVKKAVEGKRVPKQSIHSG
jgi:hypothetical protein